MKRITVIGGGASGTLLATNLLKHDSLQRLEINLVEMRTRIGEGVAFSTDQDVHLLNVPAAKMGAFADDVEHFHRWLYEKGYEYRPDSFVPRKIFSDYLRENLEEAILKKAKNVTFNVFDDEAVDIVIDDNKSAQVILRSGEILYSEKITLAFGNFLPPHPSVEDKAFTSSPKYFRDPWQPDAFDKISHDDTVLIIGTGLSMVDVALRLADMGHQGHIDAISTRGLLPAVHKLGYSYPNFFDEIKGFSKITDILRSVRRHAVLADSNGSDWRAVIDSLRPHTQALWLNLPLSEKKYFMQHLSRYWNVARHRMPPEAANALDELRGTGQLRILRGHLKNIEANNEGVFNVRFATFGVEHKINANTIVNCIGSESKFDRVGSTLVKNLLAAGHIRCDDLYFGLDANPDGLVKDRAGQTGDVLFTLGTALKGVLWESTAIPEIRAQARDLARLMLMEEKYGCAHL